MTSESEPIILFDIPSKTGTPWSFNPWKTRFLLNYKGLPYKTEWVEYPDIRGRLEGHVPPGPDDDTPYTCPTIRLPSGTYIMDSKNIFSEIDSLHPSSPPLPGISHPSYNQMITILRSIIKSFYGIFIPLVPETILSIKSQPYWYETRTRDHGDLVTLRKTKGGKKGWEDSEKGFQEATALYKQNGEGPFILGGQVSYADFVWGGFLLFLKALGEYEEEEEEEGDGETKEKVNVWEEFLKRSGGPEVHEALLKALEPWLEVK